MKSTLFAEAINVTVALVIVVALALVVVVLAVDGAQESAKFEGACEYLSGKVYTMDSDHRVCIKDGKVVLRDE